MQQEFNIGNDPEPEPELDLSKSNQGEDTSLNVKPQEHTPLAILVRPTSIDHIYGQDHILGHDCTLRKIITNEKWSSIIFYGPPGTGKTTLAEIMAKKEKRRLIKLNGTLHTGKDIKAAVNSAMAIGDRPLVFIDEIHRINRGYQETLLPATEQGIIKLIGTTTHHPGIYIISALISRSIIFELNPIKTEHIVQILKRAQESQNIDVTDKALETIARKSDGDSRIALGQLEILSSLGPVTESIVNAQRTYRRHDKDGDSHYDLISAMIKSIRGSDPDAALYWMLRSLNAGEDPRYIARRLIVHASEDIGLADHRAILVANAAWEACDRVGMPECRLNLSHATTFLASCPKSGTVTAAMGRTSEYIDSQKPIGIPSALRDNHAPADRSTNKGLSNREDYMFSHDYEGGIAPQRYLPPELRFLEFRESGEETEIKNTVLNWRNTRTQKINELKT
jgi:putative ATPase